jgi:protein-tyrosine phosphatase
MATGLLRQRLAEEGLDDRYEVESVGVGALQGQGPSRNAVIVMAERYIDITDHVARTITAEDVERASLILTADQQHAELIRQTWTHHAWKVHRLSEMAGKRQDIKDPYLGPIQKYRACADTIARYIDAGFERILELA